MKRNYDDSERFLGNNFFSLHMFKLEVKNDSQQPKKASPKRITKISSSNSIVKEKTIKTASIYNFPCSYEQD